MEGKRSRKNLRRVDVTVTDGARVKFELSFQIRAQGRAGIKLRYIIRNEA